MFLHELFPQILRFCELLFISFICNLPSRHIHFLTLRWAPEFLDVVLRLSSLSLHCTCLQSLVYFETLSRALCNFFFFLKKHIIFAKRIFSSICCSLLFVSGAFWWYPELVAGYCYFMCLSARCEISFPYTWWFIYSSMLLLELILKPHGLSWLHCIAHLRFTLEFFAKLLSFLAQCLILLACGYVLLHFEFIIPVIQGFLLNILCQSVIVSLNGLFLFLLLSVVHVFSPKAFRRPVCNAALLWIPRWLETASKVECLPNS